MPHWALALVLLQFFIMGNNFFVISCLLPWLRKLLQYGVCFKERILILSEERILILSEERILILSEEILSFES